MAIVRREELHRRGDAVEVAGDERHVARLEGDVGAGADGDADIGLRECRRVVDAVADHGHPLPRVLQRLHLGRLLLGQDLGEDLVDADLRRDRRPRRGGRRR